MEIALRFLDFLNVLILYIVQQNVHINNVDMCDVYVQDMLIAGIGTLHYHVIIIFL
jgi:hypothetical protein